MRSVITSIWMMLACLVALTGNAQDHARETSGRSKTILRFPNSDLPFLSITDGPAEKPSASVGSTQKKKPPAPASNVQNSIPLLDSADNEYSSAIQQADHETPIPLRTPTNKKPVESDWGASSNTKFRWPNNSNPLITITDGPASKPPQKWSPARPNGSRAYAPSTTSSNIARAAYQVAEDVPPPAKLPPPVAKLPQPKAPPVVNVEPVPDEADTEPMEPDFASTLPPLQVPRMIPPPVIEAAPPARRSWWRPAVPETSLYWFRGEYLYWDVDGQRVPSLITSSQFGTAIQDVGVPGLATTIPVYGDTSLADGGASGYRLELGIRLDRDAVNSISGSYFGLGDQSTHFEVTSAQSPYLARPYISVNNLILGPAADVVAFPGVYSGRVSVDSDSDFEGADLLFRHTFDEDPMRRWQWVAGYRYLGLDDSLLIAASRQALDQSQGFPIGTIIDDFDRFSTSNTFHGGSMGISGVARNGRWTLEALMKLGIGSTRAKANLVGQQTTTIPGGNAVIVPAGLLVQNTNAGDYSEREFSMVPELGLTLGCNLTQRLRATIGYNLIYWSRVARAGDQIDPLVNGNLLAPVGLNRPAFEWEWDDYLAHGLSAGLDWRF